MNLIKSLILIGIYLGIHVAVWLELFNLAITVNTVTVIVVKLASKAYLF